jgi:hypothetical protein
MGVIFGVVNIMVAVWFYSSAVSVKKQAFIWAVVGGLSFLAFKVLGYSLIAILQDSIDQFYLDDLSDQGYEQSERSADNFSNETFDDQNTAAGIFYEFFPLIVALLGVSFIRAKLILGMGYFASLKHRTPLKLVTLDFIDESITEEKQTPKFFGLLTGWWKKLTSS